METPSSVPSPTSSSGALFHPSADPPAGPPQDSERSEALYYPAAEQEVSRIFQAAGRGEPFRVDALQRVLAEMLKALATGDELFVQALAGENTDRDLPRHAVNVAVFAIKIGQGLGLREEELPWLALAACLHDLGMVTIPARLLEKVEPLTAEEIAQLRHHPEQGFKILQGLGPEFEWLANVALQEQEREDGSGYPKGLKGDEIHEYAKIIGLADVYEALTHSRRLKKVRGVFDVIKELLGAERHRFSDRVLKGFIRGVSAFPVGSLVRISSNEVARVVGTNLAFPLRPLVEVIFGPKNEPLPSPRRLDLSTNTLVYITDAFFEKP